MGYLIIVLFVIPMVLAITITTIIVKFLNSKALVKRNIQNQIQLDLAVVTITYVTLYSSMFIACEIFGPTNSVFLLNTTLWILQCLFNMAFNCIIALQFIQLFNIFSLTKWNDWSESTNLMLSHIFVFPLGIIVGSGLCSARAGSCRKTAIYNHFIIDSLKTTDDKYSYLSGITWICYGIIILTSQISIEVRRFVLNKADEKADILALSAAKKLHDAISKAKSQAPIELGIHNNIIADTQNFAQDVYPRLFQHLKVTITTATQNKVIQDLEKPTTFDEYQKHQALQQVSKHTKLFQGIDNIFSVSQMLTTELAEVEVIPVNEVNQTSDFVNNSTIGQPENDHADIPGVNFINVKCIYFSYERRFGSFYYVHVIRKKLLK
jgi:hypothetical protein